MSPTQPSSLIVHKVCIIGAGPAGLMAAEILATSSAAKNLSIEVYDAMPTAGRKFLLAGIGGLNLTHSEELPAFIQRYGACANQLAPLVSAYGAPQVQAWAASLGIETFVGSSGRIFPTNMKAAPLLRSWLSRLRSAGVQFHMRHKWVGWNQENELCFQTPEGNKTLTTDSVILALGGASWPKLGSTGDWFDVLHGQNVALSPLAPSNCGFDVLGKALDGWSEHFASRFAGQPLKTIAIEGQRGEFVITQSGVEGSLIYTFSSLWRDQLKAMGSASFALDLLPDFSPDRVEQAVAHPRGARSISSHLKSRLGLSGIKMGLLFELLSPAQLNNPADLAKAIKGLTITLSRPRPIAEAISTAGGVKWEALGLDLELKAKPGVYCAGEMLDWEAPTGGYLLTACLASGRGAALGVLARLIPQRE